MFIGYTRTSTPGAGGGRALTTAEIFQIAGPLESLKVSEYPARRLVCGELARGEELELRLDDGHSVLLLFNSSPLRDATGAAIGEPPI